MTAEETGALSQPEEQTKACPDCAETIKAEANVCRYCGHRFGAVPGAGGKSVAGATVLSLILGGLGQLYLGEHRRGAFYLATIAICIAGGLLWVAPGPWIVVSLISAIDAYGAAKRQNKTGELSGIGSGMWVMLAATLVIVGYQAAKYSETPPESSADSPLSDWSRGRYDSCIMEGLIAPNRCAEIYLTP